MKKMLKVVFFIIVTVFMVSCGDKNVVPKEYLGDYELLDPKAKVTEQGKVINNDLEFCTGRASVRKKGDRYIFKIERKAVQEDAEWFMKGWSDDLTANVKLRSITGEKGEYKEVYYTTFTDEKINGYENDHPGSIYYVWTKGAIEPVFEKENGRYFMTIEGERFIKVK